MRGLGITVLIILLAMPIALAGHFDAGVPIFDDAISWDWKNHDVCDVSIKPSAYVAQMDDLEFNVDVCNRLVDKHVATLAGRVHIGDSSVSAGNGLPFINSIGFLDQNRHKFSLGTIVIPNSRPHEVVDYNFAGGRVCGEEIKIKFSKFDGTLDTPGVTSHPIIEHFEAHDDDEGYNNCKKVFNKPGGGNYVNFQQYQGWVLEDGMSAYEFPIYCESVEFHVTGYLDQTNWCFAMDGALSEPGCFITGGGPYTLDNSADTELDNSGSGNSLWGWMDSTTLGATRFQKVDSVTFFMKDNTDSTGGFKYHFTCVNPPDPTIHDDYCRDPQGADGEWEPEANASAATKCCYADTEGVDQYFGNSWYTCQGGQWLDPEAVCRLDHEWEPSLTSDNCCDTAGKVANDGTIDWYCLLDDTDPTKLKWYQEEATLTCGASGEGQRLASDPASYCCDASNAGYPHLNPDKRFFCEDAGSSYVLTPITAPSPVTHSTTTPQLAYLWENSQWNECDSSRILNNDSSYICDTLDADWLVCDCEIGVSEQNCAFQDAPGNKGIVDRAGQTYYCTDGNVWSTDSNSAGVCDPADYIDGECCVKGKFLIDTYGTAPDIYTKVCFDGVTYDSDPANDGPLISPVRVATT